MYITDIESVNAPNFAETADYIRTCVVIIIIYIYKNLQTVTYALSRLFKNWMFNFVSLLKYKRQVTNCENLRSEA